MSTPIGSTNYAGNPALEPASFPAQPSPAMPPATAMGTTSYATYQPDGTVEMPPSSGAEANALDFTAAQVRAVVCRADEAVGKAVDAGRSARALADVGHMMPHPEMEVETARNQLYFAFQSVRSAENAIDSLLNNADGTPNQSLDPALREQLTAAKTRLEDSHVDIQSGNIRLNQAFPQH